jgi:hypothetical protein
MQVELLIKLLAPLTSAEKQKAFVTLTVVHKINNKKSAGSVSFIIRFKWKKNLVLIKRTVKSFRPHLFRHAEYKLQLNCALEDIYCGSTIQFPAISLQWQNALGRTPSFLQKSAGDSLISLSYWDRDRVGDIFEVNVLPSLGGTVFASCDSACKCIPSLSASILILCAKWMQTIKVGMVVNLKQRTEWRAKWIPVRRARSRDEYKEWETRLIEIINYISIFITGAHHQAGSQPAKQKQCSSRRKVLVGLVGLRAPDLRINWKMQIKEFAWLNVCASQRWRALSLLYIFLFLIFSPLGSSHFNNLAFFTLFDSAGSWDIFLLLRLIWDNCGVRKLCRKNWPRLLFSWDLFANAPLWLETQTASEIFQYSFINKSAAVKIFSPVFFSRHKLLGKKSPLCHTCNK